MKYLLDDGDEHLGGHGAPDLRLHSALADRLGSMSRRLSRQDSGAMPMPRNGSAHDSTRMPELPPRRYTMRAKLGHGTNSMT